MDWIVNSVVGIVMLVAGFGLDRLWEWRKKKKAGLTGQAHRIITKLGKSVQSFDGYTNLISIFRLFIQPMISKFAVSNERNSQ